LFVQLATEKELVTQQGYDLVTQQGYD